MNSIKSIAHLIGRSVAGCGLLVTTSCTIPQDSGKTGSDPAFQKAQNEYSTCVLEARTLARKGQMEQALKVINDFESSCSDKDVAKKIGPMKIAYKARASEIVETRHNELKKQARGLAQQKKYPQAVSLIESYQKSCKDPALARDLDPMKTAYRAMMK